MGLTRNMIKAIYHNFCSCWNRTINKVVKSYIWNWNELEIDQSFMENEPKANITFEVDFFLSSNEKPFSFITDQSQVEVIRKPFPWKLLVFWEVKHVWCFERKVFWKNLGYIISEWNSYLRVVNGGEGKKVNIEHKVKPLR